MSNKLIMPLQAFGCGDVLFTQSLMHDFINEGYRVIWPVQNHFVSWLSYAYPDICFIPETLVKPELFELKKDCVVNDVRILPIRFAEHIMGRPYKFHMVSKYEMFGKDWQMWKRDALPKRNITKEKELRAELGITKGMKYNFVQTRFGSNGQYHLPITPTNDYPNIEMRLNDGYSLFDYMGCLENAESIFVVSSATLYLIECMELRATEIHIYNRTPIEKNLDYVRFLFTKDYILHE